VIAKRLNRKWVLRGIGVAAVLVIACATVWGVVAAFGNSRHRSAMEVQRREFDAAVEEIRAEVLRGMPLEEFYHSRYSGRNGWHELAPLLSVLDDRDNTSDLRRTADWLEDYYTYGLDDDGNAYPESVIKAWVVQSDAIARAIEAASRYDVLARPIAEHSLDDPVGGLPVLKLTSAAIGRCKALLRLGRQQQAEQELLNLIRCAALQRYPSTLMDYLVAGGMLMFGLENARMWIAHGMMSPETAAGMVALEWDPVTVFQAAMQGDVAYGAVLLSHEIPDFVEQSRLAWARGEPLGRRDFPWFLQGIDHSLFELEATGIQGHYKFCSVLYSELAQTMRQDLANWRAVSRPPPWDSAAVDDVFTFGLGSAANAPLSFGANFVVNLRADVQRVLLRLEVLRVTEGPLPERREMVEAIVAEYPSVRLSWRVNTSSLNTIPPIRGELANPLFEVSTDPPELKPDRPRVDFQIPF